MENNKDRILSFYNRLRTRPLLTVLIILTISLLVVLLIQIPYWLGEYGGVKTNFSAGDILAFFGTIIASVATIFLGVIAYVQNVRLNEVNSELMEIQNQSLIPIIDIASYKIYSSRLPSKELNKQNYKCLLAQKNKNDYKLPIIEASIHLYNEMTIYEKLGIELQLQNITSNLIKRIKILEIKTNIIESGITSTQREFDLSEYRGINSTKRIIKSDEDLNFHLNILLEGDDSKNRISGKMSVIDIHFEVESLVSKYYEAVRLYILNNEMIDVEYSFNNEDFRS